MRERALLTKRIALCFIMAIALAVMLIPAGSQNGAGKVYAASPITAGCSSIRRTSATAAEAWVYSDTAGSIYYVVDELAVCDKTAAEIISSSNSSVAVAKNGVSSVSVSDANGLYKGKKYIHFVVSGKDADENDVMSDIITIEMPMHYWYVENFEAYPDGQASGSASMTLDANHKIYEESENKVYKISGNNETTPGITTGKNRDACITILEGKIKSGADTPSAYLSLQYNEYIYYAGHNYGSRVTYNIAGVCMEDGIWKSYVSNGSSSNTTIELDNMSGSNPVKNKWYLVRIIYDSSLHTFDIYIDGKKANSEPIAGAVYNSDQNGGNNINRFRMASVTGKDTFFDNIKAYSYPTDVDDVIDTRVKFSKTTANYVGSQNIELSTELEDAVIYYTTDGKYPDGSATKYTGEISVDSTTTIRAVAGYGEGASFIPESVAYSETYTILAKSNIKGDGIYRSSATVADVLFISDVKGEVYYYISDKSDIPDPKDTTIEWIDSGVEVEQNTTAKVNIKKNGLESGAMYINVVVKDSAGYSNVLQYYAPYDVYLKEGFTEYLEDVDSSASLFGTSKSYEKIIKVDEDNALSKYVNYYNDRRVTMANHTSATWIINGDIRFEDSSDGGYLEFASIGVGAKSGKWYARTNNTMGSVLLSDEMTVQNNKWYNIRMVYDRNKGLFDVYIDGKKINSEPLETENTNNSNVYLQTNGGTHDSASNTTYYDNIEAYRFEKTDNKAYVNFSPQSRTYTSDLTVNLDVGDETRTIIYTTDGTYPEYGNTSTKVYDYTNKIVLKKSDTKVTALAGKLVGEVFYAESIAYSENYTYLSEGPKINGQSISRTTESNVYVWFYSDSAGKAYYKVTESADPVEGTNLKTYITENNYTAYNVLENKVNAVKMTEGMSTGKKYAHVIVEDKEGNFSNELIYEMPYDRFRYDDFEEFKNGTKVKDATVLNTNNVLDSNYLVYGYSDKAMNVTDPTDPANNVYKVTGTYPAALNGNSYYGLGGTGNGTIVLEGRMMSELSSPTAYFAFGNSWNEGACLKDGVWSSVVGKDANVNNAEIIRFDNAGEVAYTPKQWYTIRIVYDIDKRVFDAYVNGVKMNDAPIKETMGFGNHISLGASGTTDAYYDDIRVYAFKSGADRNDSVVTFKPAAGKYSKEQPVELTTAQAGRTIYYTTDGSYPNPDLSKAGNTTKIYDAEAKIKVENGDTTITALAGITEDGKFKAESVAYSADYSITGAPVISGNSVYRESATKATVWLKSDIAGEVYYKASESDTAPQVDNDTLDDNWRKADSDVEADKTMSIAVTKDMSIRAKYIYVVVKDADGSFSNVLSYKMPYEFYFFDDCEASIMDTNEVFGSWGKYERYEKEPGKDNMIYAYRYAAQDMFNLPYVSAGNTIIFEAKVMSDYDNATLGLGCGNDYQAMIYTENGKWYVYNGKGNKTELDNMSSKGFVSNTWYSIKIEYSIKEVERTINVYIDDELANSSPINCVSTSGKNTVCMQGVSYTSDTSQSAYFDDITWYVDVSKVENATSPKVVRNLVYSGENQTGITYDKNLASYTITANNATADDETGVIYAKEAGNYSATFTLCDGYVWADGTKAPKTLSWSIAKKPVTIATKATKVYNGNDDATIEVDTTVGYKGITGIVDADLTEIEAETKNISVTPESATGYYIDKYAGPGKSITLESADAFTITGTGSENYVVDEQEITGDITPAVQTIAKARTLQAGVNDTITDNQLKTAVKGAKGTLSFEITDGSEYAAYTAGTGLVINENANGKTIKVKATAAAGDLNGDDIPEYAANTEGVVFDVVVNSKDSQTVIFAKPSLSVVYGKTGEGQTAEVIVDDGETAGAVTYSIDDPADLSVITVDKTTGTITTVGVGTATVTATAAATSKYNQATASYTVTVAEAPQAAPNVGKKDESVAGKKDGALTGLTTDMEYRTDGETTYKAVTADMIKDGTLNGLAAGTYYVRIKAKTNYSASADTKVVIAVGGADEKLTFAKSEITATYGDTGVGQKAASNVSDGGAITYSSDNTEVAEVNAATGDVTIKGVGTAKITAVSAATTIYSGSSASYTLTVNKASQKAPSATVKPESIEGVSDGSITGLTSDMEYRKHGETTYTPVTGDSITGLAPGTYYVRVKANKNYEASEDVAVVIAAGKEEDISATITYAENIPVEVKEEVIKKTNTDNKDIDGSVSKYLMPKAIVKKQTIKLTWNKITGADGYIIYGNLCGKKLERITEITNGNTKSWTAKKLKKGKYYKYVVVAYKTVKSGQQKVITTSKTVHAVTDGGKKGNPTGLTIKKTKINVKVGKKQTIKATLKYKKKVATHVAKFRFESDDPTIATVDYKKGVVKGVKKGKTFIYVFTQNGICKKVTVTVK